jgi:hypothetical protein
MCGVIVLVDATLIETVFDESLRRLGRMRGEPELSRRTEGDLPGAG